MYDKTYQARANIWNTRQTTTAATRPFWLRLSLLTVAKMMVNIRKRRNLIGRSGRISKRSIEKLAIAYTQVAIHRLAANICLTCFIGPERDNVSNPH
jgi:hypothetical protein